MTISREYTVTQDIRICFLGDSLVNGTGDETALGWAGRLCVAAANQGTPVTYYNLGIRRNTSQDIQRRWQQECALRLPDFCDARVVLSCGVNDTVIEEGRLRMSPEAACENVRALLREAQQKYTVLMVGPPPVEEDEQNTRIAALSRSFAHEAETLGIPYIDLFMSLVDDEDYTLEVSNGDGYHPTSKGYTKMAQIVAASPYWWF
ncbi:MAG: lipase [Leptolyngbya sp. SIO1D8]|nr:lipase [Leptolyngbya sp. SIO1D8]